MRYVSVCDGIGAAHVAWQQLGWQCQWTSEIEPFPVAVVDHHYGFRNLGDMTKITEDMIDAPVDLLVGGTPCQSFSVAGLRGGLADPRGNLALRFVQLAAVMQPKWVVWENVPGVLSSGKGRDFGTFLGALGELGYGFAYRVLDAQWFGVAQRRRRVFVVGYLGDWRRAAAVLFERESVFGNPPTRGATGQGTAARTKGGPDTCGTLCADRHPGGYSGQDAYTGRLVAEPQAIYSNESRCDNIPPAGLSPPLKIGSDGGGNPPAVAFKPSHYTRGKDGKPAEVVAPLSADADKGDQDTVVAMPYTKSKRAQSVADDETWVPGDVSPTMRCFDQGDTRATTVVAVDLQNVTAGGDIAGTLDTTRPSRGGGQAVAINVATPMAVRRLTPRECERLQGFPEAIESVTIGACIEHRSRSVLVAIKCRKWLDSACNAGDEKLSRDACIADEHLNVSHLDSDPLAVVSVLTDYESSIQAIRSRGKLIWSACSADESGEFLHVLKKGNIAERLAQGVRCLATETQGGKAESRLLISRFTQANLGSKHASKCGEEIQGCASDADQGALSARFTTSDLGRLTPAIDCELATSACSVFAAISGCIPSETLPESFCIRIDVQSPYTLVTYRGKPAADGPRCRALGNSMAVPVMRWIGERIKRVDELA